MSEPEPEPLAPCPFCGSANVWIKVADLEFTPPAAGLRDIDERSEVLRLLRRAPQGPPLAAECQDCRARGPDVVYAGADENDVRRAWNRRSPPHTETPA
jgi:hypothetical protein